MVKSYHAKSQSGLNVSYMMAVRRFPLPWSIEETPARFIVRDRGASARLRLSRGRDRGANDRQALSGAGNGCRFSVKQIASRRLLHILRPRSCIVERQPPGSCSDQISSLRSNAASISERARRCASIAAKIGSGLVAASAGSDAAGSIAAPARMARHDVVVVIVISKFV